MQNPNQIVTSSLAVAHKLHCRVRQFGPKCNWKTTFCTKSCRCHKTRNIDLFTRYSYCGMAALWTRQL